jgi:OOP family OmpA-OmpF porin
MKKIISILLLTIAPAVFAQEAPQGYLTDSNGQIVRSGTGLCWHTGYWTPANAVEGCDPVAKKGPVGNKITLSADVLFDFNKATLKPEGKKALDSVVTHLMEFSTVEVLAVTGYTDRIGSDKYNQTLSQKRADAVKAYFVSQKIDGNSIVNQGRGKANPVTGNNCKGAVTNKLIACLAPDRRAVIEILGTK